MHTFPDTPLPARSTQSLGYKKIGGKKREQHNKCVDGYRDKCVGWGTTPLGHSSASDGVACHPRAGRWRRDAGGGTAAPGHTPRGRRASTMLKSGPLLVLGDCKQRVLLRVFRGSGGAASRWSQVNEIQPSGCCIHSQVHSGMQGRASPPHTLLHVHTCWHTPEAHHTASTTMVHVAYNEHGLTSWGTRGGPRRWPARWWGPSRS
jgi:hypothetical protein